MRSTLQQLAAFGAKIKVKGETGAESIPTHFSRTDLALDEVLTSTETGGESVGKITQGATGEVFALKSA